MAGDMNLTRRSFFKVIGALGAVAAVPSFATSLIEEAVALPKKAVQVGLIREMRAYDLERDCWEVRYDVLTQDNSLQLTASFIIYDEAQIEQFREIAKDAFEMEMKERGIWWNDIKPLPAVHGALKQQWLPA